MNFQPQYTGLMNRKHFLQTSALAGFSIASGLWPSPSKQTHIFTLSCDDGFQKSFLKIADLYEAHGLKACLNVIASGHMPKFKAVDDWILPELMGSFEDWNALKQRGHEVMPHSWQHLNLARQPIKKAKKLVDRCLDYFEEHLEGYDPAYAVFNFPFNASTDEIEAHTLTRVRALRTFVRGGRRDAINPIPTTTAPMKLTCRSMGPDNIDGWVEERVNAFLANPEGGWLILNVHGLDDEGWGPMSTAYLKQLLARLVKVDYLEILPAGEVLKRTTSK